MIDKEQVIFAILEKKAEHKNSIAILEKFNPAVDWSTKIKEPSDEVLLWKIFSEEVMNFMDAEDRTSWNADEEPCEHITDAIERATLWLIHFGFYEALDAVNKKKESEAIGDSSEPEVTEQTDIEQVA